MKGVVSNSTMRGIKGVERVAARQGAGHVAAHDAGGAVRGVGGIKGSCKQQDKALAMWRLMTLVVQVRGMAVYGPVGVTEAAGAGLDVLTATLAEQHRQSPQVTAVGCKSRWQMPGWMC